MKDKRFNNDKGVTLIEIIIAIAISAVLVALAGLSLSVIMGADTNKSAKALESMIVRSKSECMGKADKGAITISPTGSGMKAKIGSGADESICPRRVKTYFTQLATDEPVESTGLMNPLGSNVVLEFGSDGSVKSVTVGGGSASTAKSMMYEFAFKRGNRVDAVAVYASTGKTEYVSWFE